VTFAENDALIFKEYAVKTLGIDQENVIFLQNAKAIEMHRAIEKISLLIKNTNGKAEVFFYYAGHGFPDEQTKESYLMPVDISGTDLRFAVKLKNVYASLTKYPSQKITLFLDACFSGGARNQGLLAARGVKVRTKQNMLNGNLIVFSASSGDQSSLPYKEKEHGLFTYYLLKSFQESKGNLTYRKLSDYLSEKVGVKSVLINNKEQNPQTNISPEVINSWEKWELNK